MNRALQGKRIILLEDMVDVNPILKGAEGTIEGEDAIGQIHVKWDNGRSLAVIPDVDKYEIK